MTRVLVRFAPASLRTSHAGLDLDASADRYRDALADALARALPRCALEVRVDPAASGLVVEVTSDDVALARTIERDVLDHAWVVRQTSDWAVVG